MTTRKTSARKTFARKTSARNTSAPKTSAPKAPARKIAPASSISAPAPSVPAKRKSAEPALPPVASPVAAVAAAPANTMAGKAATPDAGFRSKKAGKKERKAKDDDRAGGKSKLVRDSFTMPPDDYALIATLKARTLASGTSVKKSELLRAGLNALAAMPAAQLIGLLASMPTVKTGRPGKKK